MTKYIRWVAVLLISVWTVLAVAESDPVTMLRSVANSMLAGLKSHKATLKKDPSVVYALAERIIVPHADLTEMSKRVLPPQTWNGATAAQRAAFQREFTTTLIRTYASALASYDNETVEFFPVRGGVAGKTTVNVNSQIDREDGPPVAVSYSLVRVGGSWRLYDMTVEGVSMLESFRSQFADQLSRGDMANLLQVLKQHNESNSQGGNA